MNFVAYIYVLLWTAIILGFLIVVPLSVLKALGIDPPQPLKGLLDYVLLSIPAIAFIICLIFKRKIFKKV